MYIDKATGMCAFKPLELEATGCAYNEDFPDLSQGPDESCTLTGTTRNFCGSAGDLSSTLVLAVSRRGNMDASQCTPE
jgi:hypothetical protein